MLRDAGTKIGIRFRKKPAPAIAQAKGQAKEQATTEPKLPLDSGPVLSKSPDASVEKAPDSQKAREATPSTESAEPKKSPVVQESGASGLEQGPNGTIAQLEDSEGIEVTDKGCHEGIALLTDVQATLGILREGSVAASKSSDLLTLAGKSVFSTFSGLAGAYLVADGVNQMKNGNTATEKLAGASDSSWGAQVLFTHLPLAQTTAMTIAAQGLGALGGTIQAGLGLHKAAQGFGLLKNEDGERVRSKEKVLVGLGDTATGATWALASLAVAPGITVPAFLTFALATRAYQHRHKLVEAGKALVQHGRDTRENIKYLGSMIFQRNNPESFANKEHTRAHEASKKVDEMMATFQREVKEGKSAPEAIAAMHKKRQELFGKDA